MINGDASTSTILINDLDAGNPLHMNPNDSSSTTLIPFKLPGSKIIDSGLVSIRSALLTRDPLPEVKDAYKLCQERNPIDESGGLYLFDTDSDKSLGKANMVMSCNVSKNLWHSRLCHPADQVLHVLKNDLKLSKNTNVSAYEVRELHGHLVGVASSNTILINDLVAGNPLHMNPNDSSSTTLIPFKLPGSKIIESGDVLFGQWDRCNVVVFTWIMNCVSHDVYMGLVYHAGAASVWKELGETCDKSVRSALLTRDPLPEEATTSHSSSSFTAEQKKLLNLINKIPSGSIHANMAEANQNLTVSTIGMFNILDISNLKINASHPNETLATISHTGNLKITNNVVLYDFLVEPGYCVRRQPFGTGSEFGGLYLFDTDSDKSLGKANMVMYVVPTGRVVVPTGRYVVPAGKVIIIVSPGRLSLVPTSRVLSPGSDNESDDASVHSDANIAQQQQNIQPQIITTVSNNNAKFPYLKKDEYEVWAMKMEYWITNNDMNIWKVIQNGNSLKRTGRDRDGRVIILPPTTADEHIAVQRESKARTTLLQSIPDDHVADFHYMDDARDIWNAVKARISEAERLHKGYDRMQKILSQLNQLKAKPEDEDINLKFLRALPSSWSQVALTLKTKGGLELLSFDDLYYKLKTLEVDIKGYSTFSSSQSADVLQSFVADTEPEQQLAYEDFDQIEKLDLEEMDLNGKWLCFLLEYTSLSRKAGRKIDFDKKESARFNKKKVRCYKCLQRGHFARECRAKGGNDKQRYSSFKIQEVGKKDKKIPNALITVDTLVDWTDHDGQSDGVIASKAGGDNKGSQLLQVDAGDFVSYGVSLSETAKKDLQTKLDNHLVQTKKWRTSSKNLFRLVDSSMSVRTKVGLGFTNYIGENELGWDDSAFSIFTTNSEEVEGRPHFNRFAKTDSMKVVPLPLIRDYTPLSDHTDLEESQMYYGTKSSISGDSNSVSNDFVSCDNSDKSTEVNSNNFASSDLNVKSLEPMSNDSISRASTSSVSTSESEAEIESNVGTPIQEPIIVRDLPSFSCNSSDKNGNTSRTYCNKNGSFNKKAGHFRKHASSVSKLCFDVV
ncbi:putative ribonuclease H-like domain-containing protein [Tanacetum coccineum]